MNRFESVNRVYLPYVEKYLGGKPLQNILVCGGNIGSVETELKRHRKFDYDKMFHFEVVEESIDYEKVISHKYNITLQFNTIVVNDETGEEEYGEIIEELLDIPDSYEEGLKIFQEIKYN